MAEVERSAMKVVRAHFQYLGIAGPSVADVEQVIVALRRAGMFKAYVKP